MINNSKIEINRIYNEDCINTMARMPDNFIDAIVTDPPYGTSFMSKKWDNIPGVEIWKDCLRILKPGGHLLAFVGTRTQHRTICNIEDAGFEIRDIIAWVYGSGFPKNLNISKAIQKHEGIELYDTGVISKISRPNIKEDLYKSGKVGKNFTIKHVTTLRAKQWEGWGTNLKPALELIVIARKPLSEKTIAENVLKWGTGGLNINECRIKTNKQHDRFPANLIHDGSDEVMELFPETKSGLMKKGTKRLNSVNKNKICYGEYKSDNTFNDTIDDEGSAARFFYCAKASKADRGKYNIHVTVKPVKLIKYLIKLVTKVNGLVYDPFIGSGTTAISARMINRNYIGSEIDEDYIKISEKRLSNVIDI